VKPALAKPVHALALPSASVKEEKLLTEESPGGSSEPAEDTNAAWQWHARPQLHQQLRAIGARQGSPPLPRPPRYDASLAEERKERMRALDMQRLQEKVAAGAADEEQVVAIAATLGACAGAALLFCAAQRAPPRAHALTPPTHTHPPHAQPSPQRATSPPPRRPSKCWRRSGAARWSLS
jgi:hypothetical protein